MIYSFDGQSRITRRRCDQCDGEHDSVVGFVLGDGTAHATYLAAWYPHHEAAWVDVTLGSWREPDYPDNVTFGCRIGFFGGQAEPACSLVHAAQTHDDDEFFGTKLTRDEALAHPWLDSFWSVVDWLILNDATLNEHFHMHPQPKSSP